MVITVTARRRTHTIAGGVEVGLHATVPIAVSRSMAACGCYIKYVRYWRSTRLRDSLIDLRDRILGSSGDMCGQAGHHMTNSIFADLRPRLRKVGKDLTAS